MLKYVIVEARHRLKLHIPMTGVEHGMSGGLGSFEWYNILKCDPDFLSIRITILTISAYPLYSCLLYTFFKENLLYFKIFKRETLLSLWHSVCLLPKTRK